MEAELSINESRIQEIRIRARTLASKPTNDGHDINKRFTLFVLLEMWNFLFQFNCYRTEYRSVTLKVK